MVLTGGRVSSLACSVGHPACDSRSSTKRTSHTLAGHNRGLRITTVSRALAVGSDPTLASRPRVAVRGGHWLLTTVRGHLGDTALMRRPGARRPGARPLGAAYLAGPVTTAPLPDGGGTHILTVGAFLSPLSPGQYTVSISGGAFGAGISTT
jgi:hypothetical protein